MNEENHLPALQDRHQPHNQTSKQKDNSENFPKQNQSTCGTSLQEMGPHNGADRVEFLARTPSGRALPTLAGAAFTGGTSLGKAQFFQQLSWAHSDYLGKPPLLKVNYL